MFFATGLSAGPLGSAHPLTAPYQAFKTKNGFVNIGGANQPNWERIADTLGHPEWKTDPRFDTNTARLMHQQELAHEIEVVLAQHPTEHWISRLDSAGVPVGPVNTIEEAFSHPQAVAREMVVETTHPIAGRIKGVGHPIKFSGSARPEPKPAPELGEHSREILLSFGFSEAEISALIAEKVVS
jgi:crotonobetainyl-CoA:carnitine CoA-transferase CaiB-like acyl-CoA transferase